MQNSKELTSIEYLSRIAPRIFTQRMRFTRGTKKQQAPTKQELQTPEVSAFLPNDTHGTRSDIQPEIPNIVCLRRRAVI